VQSKALQVLREVRALMNLKGYSVLQVFAAPSVNDYLTNYKRRPILDLEEAVGRRSCSGPSRATRSTSYTTAS